MGEVGRARSRRPMTRRSCQSRWGLWPLFPDRPVGSSVCLRSVRWRLGPVVSRGGVVVVAGQGGGVDVDGGVIEAGDAVDELVLGLVGDCVSVDTTESV